MKILFKSTRGKSKLITSSEAIIKGIAEDGGLYIPTDIPKIDMSLKDMTKLTYNELTHYILSKYLTDYDEWELSEAITKAYNEKFDSRELVRLNEKGNVVFLELYHGPTLAFKDMALSLLPHLLKIALMKQRITKKIIILTATSGDTGKAALEGFANVDNTKIIVIYPQNGVSEIQKRQMITQEGNNTLVVGIYGNFDDAQNGVKEIFNDTAYKELLDRKGYLLSSANSINIGRLVPQIVYYFYTYLKMLEKKTIHEDEKVNITVPTGNFGNILGAYYAMKMGLPVNRLICASNENNILYDYINTGIYDIQREFKTTNSPSMDILISSNLERLNYYLADENSEVIRGHMERLSREGKYAIDPFMKEKLKIFYAGFATEDETYSCIKAVYDNYNYVLDTHTAVGYAVYEKYLEDTGDDTKTIITSTASPLKFPRSVCKSLGLSTEEMDDLQLINILSSCTGLSVPEGIKMLKDQEVIHQGFCKKDNIKEVINKFIRI